MMGKTHVTVGIASAGIVAALALPEQSGLSVAFSTVVGGGLGGVAADIDIVDNDYKHDALIGQMLALGLTVLTLIGDKIFDTGIIEAISQHKIIATIGIVAYLILMIIGFQSDHREYTHSILALILCSVAVGMIYFPFVPFYVAGYSSHLLIDLLNKKGIQLFYPLKCRLCLKMCYAKGTGNSAFMYIGLFLSIVLFVYNAFL